VRAPPVRPLPRATHAAIEPLAALDPLREAPGRKPCILGVAGGTGSGKTTVVRSILDAVGPHRIALIEQDSYYRDIAWRGEAELLEHNFDHPSALDNELLVAHLAALKAGYPVEVPIYDFVRHRRTPRTRRVMPLPVILLEGILIFVEPILRQLLDLKIYVDTDADLRLIRRLGRDMSERGRSVQDILRQYLETVRPMHLEFVEPSKRWADLIIPEGGENRVALEMVVARVEKLLEAR
jgi:uridine kinase